MGGRLSRSSSCVDSAEGPGLALHPRVPDENSVAHGILTRCRETWQQMPAGEYCRVLGRNAKTLKKGGVREMERRRTCKETIRKTPMGFGGMALSLGRRAVQIEQIKVTIINVVSTFVNLICEGKARMFQEKTTWI